MSELTREQSQRVRERYQQLEELARPQRPVMVSSLRSFSYDMPTQHAEVERMMRARSNSPALVPACVSSPVPLADSPPPMSQSRLAAPSPPLVANSSLQEGPSQTDFIPQHEDIEQNLTEQRDTHEQDGKQEGQQSPQHLDTQPSQDPCACESLSLEKAAV